MKDIVKDLQQLGLTEYEAKTYLALLQNPDSTGYEVAKQSGVPRAKIYETLDSLERKGIILASAIDNKQLYRTVPYTSFLAHYQEDMQLTLARLNDQLTRLERAPEQQGFFTLRGLERIMEYATALCRTTKTRLLITGFPEEIQKLEPGIRAARERGVKTYVLSYGAASCELPDVYCHPISGTQYLQVAAFGRWLGVVSDQEQCLLGQILGDHSLALQTANQVVTFALMNWITHDIQINALQQSAPPELLSLGIDRIEHLQSMYMLEPSESAPVPVDASWPDVDSILAKVSRKLGLNRSPQDYGVYRFELTDPAATYQLTVTAADVQLCPTKQGQADLLVTISTDDFRALAVGQLPLSAFATKGRIRVSGDLALAANLQRIFH